MKVHSESDGRVSIRYLLVTVVCSVTGIALSVSLSFILAALLNAVVKTDITAFYQVGSAFLLFLGGILTGNLLAGITAVRGLTCGIISSLFSCLFLFLLHLPSSGIVFSTGWFFFECLIITVACTVGAILRAVRR